MRRHVVQVPQPVDVSSKSRQEANRFGNFGENVFELKQSLLVNINQFEELGHSRLFCQCPLVLRCSREKRIGRNFPAPFHWHSAQDSTDSHCQGCGPWRTSTPMVRPIYLSLLCSPCLKSSEHKLPVFLCSTTSLKLRHVDCVLSDGA